MIFSFSLHLLVVHGLLVESLRIDVDTVLWSTALDMWELGLVVVVVDALVALVVVDDLVLVLALALRVVAVAQG